jgi:hypothetical protein
MSPPLPTPPDPEELNKLLADGAKSAALGAGAMTARILLSTEKQSFGYVARRMGVACIVGFFSSMFVAEYVSSVKLQFCCVAALSYAAPEVCDFTLKIVREKLQAQTKQKRKR